MFICLHLFAKIYGFLYNMHQCTTARRGNAIFDCWVRGFKLPGHLPIPQNLLEHPLWSLNKLNNSNLLNLKLKQNQVK